MTTLEVEHFAETDPVVILPLAAIEQHGPHLPLSTDLEIGLGILASAFRRLPEGFPARVLPPQSVGASREHARWPGTLTLSPESLGSLVVQHGEALARHGVRRLVLGNSHGGNRHVMESAGLTLRDELGMLVVKATYPRFSRPDSVDLPEAEWRQGLHGGAVETAMMLHLRPDLVQVEEVREFPSVAGELEQEAKRLRPEGEAAFSWLAGDLNPSGVTGDARLGDAAMGERLVSHYGQVLAEVIQDAREFDLDRLA